MNYKETLMQGVRCCIQQKKKCKECPFYNDGHSKCDELREAVLNRFVAESYYLTDWSGMQEGF